MVYLIIVVISSRISSSMIYKLVTLGSYAPNAVLCLAAITTGVLN